MQEKLNILLSWLSTDYILHYGGLALIALLTFAETGLLLGILLPGGETLLFTAGLLCGTGSLEIPVLWLLLAVLVASVLGDISGFSIGRKMGAGLYEKKDNFFYKKKYLERTEKFYRKRGKNALIMGRFIPVVRTLNPFLAGATNSLTLRNFAFYSFLSSLIWGSVIILASYFLGHAFPDIKDYIRYIIPVIILLAVTPLVWSIIKERKSWLKKKAKKS